MKRRPQIIAFAVVGALTIAGFAYWNGNGRSNGTPRSDIAGLEAAAWDALGGGAVEQGGSTGDSGDGDALSSKTINTKEWLTYNNSDYGFSLRYAPDFRFTEFGDEGGNIILAEGQGGNRSFQIFVSAWDEPMEIMTEERIRRDLPNMVIKEPQVAVLGDGTRALIFVSSAESVATTREAWIIHGGRLYQITAPISLDAELAWIMSSWSF